MKPVCLVTGSAGKLGSALCRELIDTHDIAAVYRNELPQFPSQLRIPLKLGTVANKPDGDALAYCIQGDLTNKEDVRRIVDVALARFGRIDVVINSAANPRFLGKLVELCFDSRLAESQLLTNCIAPMNLISTVFQQLWKDEPAVNRELNRCVVNVSSVSGLYVYPKVGQAFYGTSKAALNFLTMHLAYELADYSVRANAVCPLRFPDAIPTSKVVSKIRELVRSDATGEVVEVLA